MLNESERCFSLRPFRSFINYVKKETKTFKLHTVDYFSSLDNPYTDFLEKEHNATVIQAPMELDWGPEHTLPEGTTPPICKPYDLGFSFFFLNEIASNCDDAFNKDLIACLKDMKEKCEYQFIAVPCVPEDEESIISIFGNFDQTWWGEKIAEVLEIETIETNSFGYFFGCHQ